MKLYHFYKGVIIYIPWSMTKHYFSVGEAVYWNVKYKTYQRRKSDNNIYVGKVYSVGEKDFSIKYLDGVA